MAGGKGKKSSCRSTDSLIVAAESGLESVLKLLYTTGNPNEVDALGRTPLHVAARTRNLDVATALLEAGANPNAADQKDRTPVHICCAQCDPVTLAALLHNGGSVNPEETHPSHESGSTTGASAGPVDEFVGLTLVSVCGERGRGQGARKVADAPLHVAVKHGAHACIRVLLTAGASVDWRGHGGSSALHVAAACSDAAAVQALLDGGADVHQVDSRGWTPLHSAAAAGSAAAVNRLITSGAHISTLDHRKRAPLCLAVDSKHVQVVQELVSHVLANGDHKGRVKCGLWSQNMMRTDTLDHLHIQVSKKVIASRQDPSELCTAVCERDVDLVQLMLEGGADVETHRRNKSLVHLCMASMTEDEQMCGGNEDGTYPGSSSELILDTLLRYDSPVTRLAGNLQPVLLAAQHNSLFAMRKLLSTCGNSPGDLACLDESLYFAAGHLNIHMVRFLQSYRAPSYVACRNALTALAIGTMNSALTTDTLLNPLTNETRSTGNTATRPNSPPHVPDVMNAEVERTFSECLDALLGVLTRLEGEQEQELARMWGACQVGTTCGVQVGSFDVKQQLKGWREDNSLVHTLTCGREAPCITPLFAEMVRRLLPLGLDMNSQLPSNTTCHHHSGMQCAVMSGRLQLVKELVAFGTDIHVLAPNDHTLLHLAAQFNQLEIAEYLIQAGCSPYARIVGGGTPLHVLCTCGHYEKPSGIGHIYLTHCKLVYPSAAHFRAYNCLVRAWCQGPLSVCMTLTDDSGATPIYLCIGCRSRLTERRTHQAPFPGTQASDDDESGCERSVDTSPSAQGCMAGPRECVCGGELFEAAVLQDMRVCMLIVPDRIACASHGGVLGELECRQESDCADGCALQLDSLPADLRVKICQLVCIGIVDRSVHPP